MESYTEETELLRQKITHQEHELARLESGDAGQVRALEQAEENSRQIQHEIAELRSALEAAEEDGRELITEQASAEAEAVPLHEWVDHVGEQLKKARAENSELSVSLASAQHSRNELRRDHLEAQQPRKQQGLDVMAICWLREHVQKSTARKAVLAEEIAAERCRRDALQEEVRCYRQESAVAEPSPPQQQRPHLDEPSLAGLLSAGRATGQAAQRPPQTPASASGLSKSELHVGPTSSGRHAPACGGSPPSRASSDEEFEFD